MEILNQTTWKNIKIGEIYMWESDCLNICNIECKISNTKSLYLTNDSFGYWFLLPGTILNKPTKIKLYKLSKVNQKRWKEE